MTDTSTDPGLDPSLRAAATFNAASDRYDAPPLGFWAHCGQHTIDRLALPRGARVLDVPCGTGASAIPAARAVGSTGSVLACDLAERMLAHARDKAAAQGLRQMEFRHADMRALGLPDASFDAVVCVFGVFFVTDMAAQVRALWRLVKPGGQLAITTWGPGLFSPAVERLGIAIAAERPELALKEHPWERLVEPAALTALLAEAGIAEEELRPVEVERRAHPLASPADWWTIALGGGLRATLDKLTPQEAARVREDNVAWLAAQGVTALRTDALYVSARKR
jgi:SAM-dependent methyltransferase